MTMRYLKGPGMTHHVLGRLMRDRSGNFAIMTAVLIPALIGTAGVAMDVTQAIQMKSEIQGFADSASLAAANAMADKGMSDADAQALAKTYLTSQLINAVETGSETAAQKAAIEKAIKDGTTVGTTTTATASGKNYTVKTNISYAMQLNALTSFVAGSTMTIGVSSTAASNSVSDTAISMYLALDRSGSMSFVTDQKNTTTSFCANYNANSWPNPYSYYPCYIRKIQALQTAATALFTSLTKADPKKTLTRVGAVTFTDTTQDPTGMAWGTTTAANYVNALPSVPTGGTDASGAMQIAYDALKVANSAEASAHSGKGDNSFQRYILLMTDGEMTGAGSSWNNGLDQKVRNLCDKAKADKDASGNGITIFSVAFMAPDKGKSLLTYCASSTDNYYEPDDMDSLIEAFDDIAQKAAKTATRLTN